MATEWDAFPIAGSPPSGGSEWDAFPKVPDTTPHMGAFGVPEAAANIVTGTGASALGGLFGAGTFLGGLATGKSAGESLDAANQNLSDIQNRFTYQPRSAEGKAVAHVAGLPFEYGTKASQWIGEQAGKPFGLGDEGNLAGGLAFGTAATLLGGKQALQAAPRVIPTARAWFDAAKAEAAGLRVPDAPAGYAPSKLAELQAASARDAPRLDAAAAAQRLGVSLDPAVSNPTLGNRFKSWAAGETELDSALSAKNARKWGEAQAQELGIPNLSIDALKAGRERAGAPYREVKAIPDVASGAQVTAAIEGILARDGMTPAVADYVRKDVAPLVDKVATMSEGGINGADVVNLTKKLRKDANTTYKNPFPEVGAQALADARMAVSKALEDLAAQRLAALDREMPGKGYGDLADRWKAAREYIAKSHVAENATNLDTGVLDPTKIAALTAKDNALTGVAADIGKVANNFSKIANPSIERFPVRERLARYGPMGVAGGLVGSLAGSPATGALAGMAAGAIGSAVLRKLISSKGYQAKHAFPQDFRPVPIVDPGIIPFVRQPSVAPLSSLAIAPEPQGLDYGAFAKDYRAKQAMDFAQPDTLIARTQAANTERMAAQDWLQGELEKQRRQPASGGMPFDLDPVTGRLRPADAGLRGATPATVESAGNNLASAVDKLSSGRAFSMNAEERVAWNARKVELTKAAPELRGLSDSAIASKVADRQWVANRIQQLKTEYADWAAAAGERFRAEQAGKLNERANNPPVLSGAERTMRKTMNSEAARRMELAQRTRRAEMQAQIDALESMSELLSAPRAGTLRDLGQGPKTRSALRDLLPP